jgi:hypothetical protein
VARCASRFANERLNSTNSCLMAFLSGWSLRFVNEFVTSGVGLLFLSISGSDHVAKRLKYST